ncbi:DENSITY-REGULATED PROTEIN-like protein [Salix purpurea]|uniref:Translation machinery-associated protein 22 n=1 Tax=Salix purpurea TaxID=77065 RepID=A0A9Q0ULZ1_SALPP|nr:DENSITY-REGULATED PROTEIN-like protein [Salix purpurea]
MRLYGHPKPSMNQNESIVNSGLISRNASLGSSKNAPELYPDLLKEADEKEAERVSEQLHSVGISSFGADGAVSSVHSGETSSFKQEEVKRLPGGKIKKKVRQEVVIEKVVRNKRKSITIIKGLDLFGIKLSDASKKLGKKFATGASVVKGPTEKEQIDVQGDIAYDIVEFITETWPDVPETAIYFIEEGKKVPAA